MTQEQQARAHWKRQTARYVVSVDNQAKSSFDTREAADREALRISERFPKLEVTVSDSELDSVATLGPTQAPEVDND